VERDLKEFFGTHFSIGVELSGITYTRWHTKQWKKDSLQVLQGAAALVHCVAVAFGAQKPLEVPCYTELHWSSLLLIYLGKE
jgi:hypothetical protein